MSTDLRDRLIDAGRVLALEGQGDYVAGHITIRLPDDPSRFLMKPAGIGLEEITRDNIVTVNLEGEKVGGPLPRHNEVFIHSEVLRARPDIHAVLHTHPIHVVAFSSLGRPFQPVSNEGVHFWGGQLSIFDETTDLIINQERGKAVARCLGENKALILRNHGIVTAAETIEEAVYLALKLDRACRIQLLAEAAGGPKLTTRTEEIAAKQKRSTRADLHVNTFGYLVRKWARLQ